MSNFYQIYHFKNLTNDPTCYKNSKTRTFIDLIMANKPPKCFQNSIIIETGLSDFHKTWKYITRRNENSDFTIATMRNYIL